MKKTLTLLAILAMASGASAAPLTPDQALSRALDSHQTKLRSQSELELIEAKSIADQATIYLFSSEDRFVITPADDLLPAVLGFGYNSAETADGRQPDNFQYWMDFLSKRAAMAAKSGRAATYVRPEREPIDMLCATQWNQNAPYNNDCPTLYGSRCPTGCVATAMAQAVKYHNWPTVGEGTSSYLWENGGRTLSYDYASTTFDWQNMLNTYNSSSSSTANKAVSTLMKMLGGSVEMMYGSDSSGAYSINIGGALANHFRYDKQVQYLPRDYYSLMEWEEIIYTSLKNYGPVIYDGQAPVGGHSFICDGYLSEGYFHINWGWGGLSDGYFLLDVLDPGQQGTGGFERYEFNSDQDAVVWLKPDTDGNSKPRPGMFWGSNGYNYTDRMVASGTSFSIGSGNDTDGFWNFGPFAIPSYAEVSIVYENMYTGEKKTNWDTLGDDFLVRYGFRNLTESFPTLVDGLHKLYFAIKESDTIQPLKVKYDTNQFVIATVSQTKAMLSYPQLSMPVVSNLAYSDSCNVHDLSLSMSATLYNNGPGNWDQTVRMEIYKDNQLYAIGEEKTLEGEVGSTQDFGYSITDPILMVNAASEPFSHKEEVDNEDSKVILPAGEYKIVMTVKNGTADTWLPLTYWHDLTLYDPTTGLSKVESDSRVPATYYDLQGRKVSDPTHQSGIYIKKSGKKSEKIAR